MYEQYLISAALQDGEEAIIPAEEKLITPKEIVGSEVQTEQEQWASEIMSEFNFTG